MKKTAIQNLFGKTDRGQYYSLKEHTSRLSGSQSQQEQKFLTDRIILHFRLCHCGLTVNIKASLQD